MKKNFYDAFSLMEMMVVLLIVAIVAAATAPMVTKKMARNAGSGDSPWVFTGLGGNIAYYMNGNDNTTVLIGTTSVPNGWTGHARLFVDSGNNAAHIAFGHGNDTPLLLTADPAGRIGFSNAQIPANSVAFGTGQTIPSTSTETVTLGQGANVNGSRSVAIGLNSTVGANAIAIGGTPPEENASNTTASANSVALGAGAQATGSNSIAIGREVTATNEGSISIGANSFATNLDNLTENKATGDNAIAIGTNAQSTQASNIAIGKLAQATGSRAIAIGSGYTESTKAIGAESIAIGTWAQAEHGSSVAIGNGAKTTTSNQIVLGSANTREIILGGESTIVTIPGCLKVNKNTLLGADGTGYRTFISHKTYGKNNWWLKSIEVESGGGNDRFRWGENYSESVFKYKYSSDRRLKNVGEKYTAGLDELKKLEFFHYTFKKDENKTPMVGVMAQDLQKVFPDAVTKGEDGYLRIRLEDMFYAVINAVKELDSKIAQIVENISDINSKIENLEKENAELQKVNSDLVKTNEELKAEIKNIEKRIEKLEK